MLRGKLIAPIATRKEESSESNDVGFHLKKQEQGEQLSPKSETKK